MITVSDHGNLKGYSQPRSIVRIDGASTWFLNWTVNLNSTHTADDFTVELPFAIMRNVPQGYLVNSPEFTSYLFTNSDVLVEIYVGFPQDPTSYTVDDLKRIMYGYIDTVDLHCSEGETVTLTGRNRMADFIDTKTTEKYQNMTASAIAMKFAQEHNLNMAITPTYTLVGNYLNKDTSYLNKDVTEWDLLTFLADQEGFELRVRDETLCFGPFDQIVGDIQTESLNYTWGQNVEVLTISRSPHGAKNLIIEVHSYDHSKGKHIKAEAKRTNAKATRSFTQRYFFSGLTMEQCQKKAEAVLDQLSKLEVVGTLNVSGNEKLVIDRPIYLYGTGLGLSEMYYIRKSTHKFDSSGNGYTCDVTFSNVLLSDESTGGL
jgi:phage protein D